MKLKPGDRFPALVATTILDLPALAPSKNGEWVHLQFRRFAGCPICNLHLRSFAARVGELANANIKELIVFHSSKEAMLPYFKNSPFETVADPKKSLYAQYGVEPSTKAKSNPKVWAYALKGMLITKPTTKIEGGTNGLPADFLISPGGRLVAVKYGEHAADQWSVDEVISIKNLVKSTD